ncbi:MAG: hypothetical protein VX231_10380 [Pseudomonadota bacterium]|nr:hypothetical protein [Pseudomonadota bacterium]
MFKNLLNSVSQHHAKLALLAVVGLLVAVFIDHALISDWQFQRSSFYINQWQSISHGLIAHSKQELIINIFALLLLFFLFPNAFKSVWWLIALAVSIASSAYGVFYYHPEIDTMSGLAGGLHGLFIYAVLRNRSSSGWLLLLALKLLIDLNAEIIPSFIISHLSITALQPANPEANLWGLAGGFLIFGIARTLALIPIIVELNKD